MTDEATTDPKPKPARAAKAAAPKATPESTAEQTYKALSEPFPAEVERSVNKGGANLTYIPYAEVVSRLNKVIGINRWSSTVVSCVRDAIDPDFIVAHVRLTATIDGVETWHDGFGGVKIKRTRKDNDPVDLGDEFKGAVSDALKKAAQHFGVAIYLARDPEALEAESAPDPRVVELFESLKQHSGALPVEKRHALNDFWAQHSGGRPKPTLGDAKPEDLEALIGECIRLSLDAEVVDEH